VRLIIDWLINSTRIFFLWYQLCAHCCPRHYGKYSTSTAARWALKWTSGPLSTQWGKNEMPKYKLESQGCQERPSKEERPQRAFGHGRTQIGGEEGGQLFVTSHPLCLGLGDFSGYKTLNARTRPIRSRPGLLVIQEENNNHYTHRQIRDSCLHNLR
jgi:hypothetical protein